MRNKYELMFQSSYEEAEEHYDELIRQHLEILYGLIDGAIKSYNSGQLRKFRQQISLLKEVAEVAYQEVKEFEEYKETLK
jgi:hypothetical protein